MNLLSFSVTSIFHVIIVEKQLIKYDILTHCLTCNFRYMSQYNSFPSVWRGLTEHRREHPVYLMATDPIFRFLLKKPRVLLTLAQISLMWLSHLKSSVMVTPRYLAEVTQDSEWSCSLDCVWSGFLLPVTVRKLHLVAWNFIFQSTSQTPMVVRSICTFSMSWSFTMTMYAMGSLAKSLTIEFMPSGRSFM